MSMLRLFPTAILLLAITSSTSAYSSSQKKTIKTTQQSSPIDRSTFLATTAASCLTFISSSPAFAKDIDPAVKGTKADPAFQACLSQCVYECTKPKGMEQRSRAECLPECKSKCATTKQQLLLGSPVSEK
ncbi:hypothetical protein HJC23_004335 [Cyclotella cryptica]|uniref:Uncharacterized protein n=1 Tax=Cyclotella cryptica TaxID=29204 RepID=A0ABD3Q422_9STRA